MKRNYIMSFSRSEVACKRELEGKARLGNIANACARALLPSVIISSVWSHAGLRFGTDISFAKKKFPKKGSLEQIDSGTETAASSI